MKRRADLCARRSARRASWPGCRGRARTRRCSPSPRPSRGARPRSWRRTPRTSRLARENRLADALVDRLLLDEDRLRDVGRARARRRRPARPRRADRRRLAPRQRRRTAQGARAARRRRRHLRGAAQRHRRRRRALPQDRQRRHPARRQRRQALQPHPRRGRAGRRHRGRPAARGGLVPRPGPPASSTELLKQRKYVDLVIPRGGEELKDYLLEHSKVPVIYAAGGNCHVYVDAAADLEKALPIIVNAKCQRPGVCNAAETLLVHHDVAAEFLPRAAEELKRRGVELVVDKAPATSSATRPSSAPTRRTTTPSSSRSSWPSASSASLDEALEHIATYGTRHSEAIVTEDLARRPAVHRRGRRRLRLRQRLHALHRRRPVRPGRRDGHLHAEAARPRPDRAAGAHLRQVRAVGRRAGAGLARGRRARLAWASWAEASTRRTSRTSPSPPRRAHDFGLERVLFVPAAAPPHKGAGERTLRRASGSR